MSAYFHLKNGNIEVYRALQVALVVKNPLPSAGDRRDLSSIPGSGRSPGGGNVDPLQYSWTEEPGGLQSMGHKELDTTERLSTAYLV